MPSIEAGELEITYEERGPRDGKPVIMLHGFPYDVHAFDDASAILSTRGFRCLIPYLRGFGATRFRSMATMRSGQQAALGVDLVAFMDALSIDSAYLGGFDWGGRAACIVAALWPARVRGLVSCGQGYNIQNIADAQRPAPPDQEARFWYMFYFNMERGRTGLSENRTELCRLIWKTWSPSWLFGEQEFRQTAASFENSDFVDIVIHSYRHRFGVAPGDPSLDHIERALAKQPKISVPTIVLQGADDGVDPPTAEDFDKACFTARYARRIIEGTGHNPPQEAPEAFAGAIVDLSG